MLQEMKCADRCLYADEERGHHTLHEECHMIHLMFPLVALRSKGEEAGLLPTDTQGP